MELSRFHCSADLPFNELASCSFGHACAAESHVRYLRSGSSLGDEPDGQRKASTFPSCKLDSFHHSLQKEDVTASPTTATL